MGAGTPVFISRSVNSVAWPHENSRMNFQRQACLPLSGHNFVSTSQNIIFKRQKDMQRVAMWSVTAASCECWVFIWVFFLPQSYEHDLNVWSFAYCVSLCRHIQAVNKQMNCKTWITYLPSVRLPFALTKMGGEGQNTKDDLSSKGFSLEYVHFHFKIASVIYLICVRQR